MSEIYRNAVNEIMGGKDGICAWANSKLGYLAERKAKADRVAKDDPDYDRWVKATGFAPLTESDEFEKWVWFFSMLIDGQSKEAFGREIHYSLEDCIFYKANQELKKKGTDAFSPGYHAELFEDASLKWSVIRSVEGVEEFPEGSYDELKERIRARRSEVFVKHKESEHKRARLVALDLALDNL